MYNKCVKIVSIGVDKMANVSFNTRLCNYIISQQQKDLLVIFEQFSDKVTDPESNIFFLQNDILDRILNNIKNCTKKTITTTALFKGITNREKEIISSLNLHYKIAQNAYHCKILGIDLFDKEKFMEALNIELNVISTRYNLHANDDYNKLYKFLSSLQLSLQSSDDVLSALSNQYVFFKEHSIYTQNDNEDEFVSIYGERHYKIDILKKIIEDYKKLINENNNEQQIKRSR